MGCTIYKCAQITCPKPTVCPDGQEQLQNGTDANGCPVYTCPTVKTVDNTNVSNTNVDNTNTQCPVSDLVCNSPGTKVIEHTDSNGCVKKECSCDLTYREEMCSLISNKVKDDKVTKQMICNKYSNIIKENKDTEFESKRENWLYYSDITNANFNDFLNSPIAQDDKYEVFLINSDSGFAVSKYSNGVFSLVFDNQKLVDANTNNELLNASNRTYGPDCFCYVDITVNINDCTK